METANFTENVMAMKSQIRLVPTYWWPKLDLII